MELLQKLTTAVRGGTREILELAVDANGLRIFAQEIHDSEAAIQQARREWCQVSAERIRLQREADSLQSAMDEKERQIHMALDHGQEGLAREVAQWMADNEPFLSDLRKKQRQLEEQEARLKRHLQSAIRRIEDYRRELRMVRAMASAQSATRKIVDKADILPARLGELQVSLQRIKDRQQLFADRMAAADLIDSELSGPTLDERLAEMESGARPGSAEVILERIREKRKGARPE